jgi:hypothetical protein
MVAWAGDRDGRAASYDNVRRYVTFPADWFLAHDEVSDVTKAFVNIESM